MSQSTALRAPRPSARTAPTARSVSRPAVRLRVVSAPAHLRSRAGLVVSCAALLIAGLVGLLVLNVSLERGAYELGAQRQLATTLTEQRQALQEQLAALAAPDALARRAGALGMVPAPNVAVVRLSDGKILGVPLPAPGRPSVKPAAAAPTPGPTAAPTAAATPAAKPKALPKSQATSRSTPAATSSADVKRSPSPPRTTQVGRKPAARPGPATTAGRAGTLPRTTTTR